MHRSPAAQASRISHRVRAPPPRRPSGSVSDLENRGRSSRLLGSIPKADPQEKKGKTSEQGREGRRDQADGPGARSSLHAHARLHRLRRRYAPAHVVRPEPKAPSPPSVGRRSTLAPETMRASKSPISWFDGKSCRLGLGSTTVVPLKAIAWEGRKGVALCGAKLTPASRSSCRMQPKTSVDTMAGHRSRARAVSPAWTLPLGRWGAGSVLAQVSSLSFAGPSAEASDQSPVEVAIELVQDDERADPVARRSHPVVASGRLGAVLRIDGDRFKPAAR